MFAAAVLLPRKRKKLHRQLPWLKENLRSLRRLDACTLLSKAEVEGVVGRRVLAGRQEDSAELSTCDYGNPAAPLAAGRPTDYLFQLGVFNGGSATQAKGVLEISRKNAASVEPVSGLGDDAYWDKFLRTLRVLKGRYQIDVIVGSDVGGLKTARTGAEKALAKLP